jgi:putative membrane protein
MDEVTTMMSNRMNRARIGAIMMGTAATLACAPRENAANESASAAATTATTETGGSTAAGATAGTTGDSGAMAAGATMAGGAMGDAAIAGTINTSNAAEIGSSELAQERAASADVKAFANDMIKGHRQMQKEGDQIAQKNNMTPQPGAEADQMQKMTTAALDSMKALKGAAFDQKYMAFQVQSHQMTLDKLRQFEGQTQNADLKAMVTKAIPDVQAHLERAQKIQSGLGAAKS